MLTQPSVPGPIRFLDRHGFSWSVLELRASDSSTTGGTLYFFSGGATLRLGGYPDDWSEMDWAGLERLRLRAEVLREDVTRRGMRTRLTPAEGFSPA